MRSPPGRLPPALGVDTEDRQELFQRGAQHCRPTARPSRQLPHRRQLSAAPGTSAPAKLQAPPPAAGCPTDRPATRNCNRSSRQISQGSSQSDVPISAPPRIAGCRNTLSIPSPASFFLAQIPPRGAHLAADPPVQETGKAPPAATRSATNCATAAAPAPTGASKCASRCCQTRVARSSARNRPPSLHCPKFDRSATSGL